MKFVFDNRQQAHNPQFRLENGNIVLNPDRPERVEQLLKGAQAAGYEQINSVDHGMAPISALHTPRYIRYLRSIYDLRKAQYPEIREVVPGRVCRDPIGFYSDSPEAMIGFHNADTSCPISAETWEAVYWSAQTAVTAADLVLEGANSAYALCRPSGHHAYREVAGGFCFLNNSAIAAEYLRTHNHRPVILDIDVHHGNGTQEIFYERDDVLTISLHVDPEDFYPFYAGTAAETGKGNGVGFNLNLPMPKGTGNNAYLETLSHALERVKDFGATALVVAVGLDTHENDPFKAMNITTDGFADIGRMIRDTGLPILNIQEGGYMQPALGDNLTSYLGCFK